MTVYQFASVAGTSIPFNVSTDRLDFAASYHAADMRLSETVRTVTIGGQTVTLSGAFGPFTSANFNFADGSLAEFGTVGSDSLTGSAFNDYIDIHAVDSGRDSVAAGAGDDRILAAVIADTRIDGGPGVDDLFLYRWSPDTGEPGIYVSLQDSTVISVERIHFDQTGTLKIAAETASSADLLTLDASQAPLTSYVTDVLALTVVDASLATIGVNIIGGGETFRGIGGSGDDTLASGAHPSTLQGAAGNDLLIGGVSWDVAVVHGVSTGYSLASVSSGFILTDIDPSDGNDGADTLSGINAIQYSNLRASLFSAGPDTIVGTTLQDSLLGGDGADSLSGLEGADTIDGGAGADTMSGGTGGDYYYVDNAGDLVTGEIYGSTDTVESTVDYTLPDNVERLILVGSALTGIGNTLANELIGDVGDNTLSGLSGMDTLSGGGGHDLLIGGQGNDAYIIDAGDTVVETVGSGGIDLVLSSADYNLPDGVENLTLTGAAHIGAGNATANLMQAAVASQLSSYGGGDTLLGSSGADTLSGGEGNDLYAVNNTGDVVIEDASAGIDTIQSSVNFSLASTGVENLTLTLTSAAVGEGNDLANRITGSSGGDTLTGLHGNDSLYGMAGADSLSGGAGNDSLDGGAGGDTLDGGAGNDTYVVFDVTDRVVEAADGGTDLVISLVNIDLTGSSIENLTLLGNAHLGTGNPFDNIILGNDSYNSLSGAAGNDTLSGGLGNDSLSGGDGNDSLSGGSGKDTLTGGAAADILDGGASADRFIFAAGDGHDLIVGFNTAQGDRVQIAAGATYSVSDSGGAAVLDLGGGDVLTVQGATAATVGSWLVAV